jgi:hypothetical protein
MSFFEYFPEDFPFQFGFPHIVLDIRCRSMEFTILNNKNKTASIISGKRLLGNLENSFY